MFNAQAPKTNEEHAAISEGSNADRIAISRLHKADHFVDESIWRDAIGFRFEIQTDAMS